MNILFDLYTCQFFCGGAPEYVRRVWYALQDDIAKKQLDVTLYAMLDCSKKSVVYEDLSPQYLTNHGVNIVDVSKCPISQLIINYKIDVFFIGLAQFCGALLKKDEVLPCHTICVVHDVCDEEFERLRLQEYLRLNNIPRLLARRCVMTLRKWLHYGYVMNNMRNIVSVAKHSADFHFVVVSNYTKNSLSYFFGVNRNLVNVLFSPSRLFNDSNKVSDDLVNLLKGKKYFVLLNANRESKNPEKVIAAFKRYTELIDKDKYLVTVGCRVPRFDQHIVLDFLNSSDLKYLLKHCYALVYPSFLEGFGYPPVEVMQYGKPVLASNVTSIPEVLGDAPIYFSPFYESDIFKALTSLDDSNYQMYADKSIQRYNWIHAKQEHDLSTLLIQIEGGL